MTNISEVQIERCNLFLRRGFTVIAISANNAIGRICVLRKNDFELEKSLYLIEFYNAISPPSIYLEKTFPVRISTLESVAWIGTEAFVSCGDGSVIVSSPFSANFERFQLCASSILAISALCTNELALATDSSEIHIAKYRKRKSSNKYSMKIKKTLRLASDERAVSMAASKRDPLVAVGMLNAIRLFDLAQDTSINIVAPKGPSASTIVWSLVFVDDLLFSGDSLGKVTIYKVTSGAILKTMSTHQGAVLALATNGVSVFASGTDYRIQVLSGISSNEMRFDWATVGQRIFHENDVRALACIGERWLISGGAEHDLSISDYKWTLVYPVLKKTCSISRTNGLVLMRHPTHVEIWLRPNDSKSITHDASKNDSAISSDDGKLHPKKLTHINSSSFISDACISPNGDYMCLVNEEKIQVFSIDRKIIEADNLNRPSPADFIKRTWSHEFSNEQADDGDETDDGLEESVEMRLVTAMTPSCDHLYFATENFVLRRLNFMDSSLDTLAIKRNAGNVSKIGIDEHESMMVVLTTKGLIFKLSLNKTPEHTMEDEDELMSEIKMQYNAVDCVFVSNTLVVFLCTEIEAQLVLYDIAVNVCLKTMGKNELHLGHNELLSYISDSKDGRIIASSNKGKIRILEKFQSSKPIMHTRIKRVATTEFNTERKTNSWRKGTDCRAEPFWGAEPHKLSDETKFSAVMTRRKRKISENLTDKETALFVGANVLLVGQTPESLPTQDPLKIKMFNRN